MRHRIVRAVLAVACSAVAASGAAGGQAHGAGGASPRDAAPLALTPAEYNDTIADLLGFPRDGDQWPERPALADRISPRREPSRGVFAPPPPPPVWPWQFPSEAGSNGFEGIAQGQAPSSYQVEELHLAAMHFASFAVVSPTFFACDAWTSRPAAEQKTCGWTSLERFARRAYRRPLDTEEIRRLERFLAGQRGSRSPRRGGGADGGGHSADADLSLPHPADADLSLPHRAAPDGGRRGLAAPEPVGAGVAPLLLPVGLDARQRAVRGRRGPALVRFHHQWLGTDDVLLVTPARRAFGPLFGIEARLATARDDDVEWPAIMGPVGHSMKIETELFVEQAVFDGAGTLTALMTDHHGYLSDATAPIYGQGAQRIDGPEVTRTIDLVVASIGRRKPLTLYPASFPPEERAGVLTLPPVLALGAYAVQPGPILRGVRVLERLACMHLGTPVQGAETALPPDTLTAESTNRERTAAATRPGTCNTCHQLINPPGFAFEHYDAIGRWRSHDNGQPVDASGSLVLAGGERITFTDGVDFARQLAASDRVRDCYVLHWTRYALGERLDAAAPGLNALQAGFRADDSIKTLLVSIVGSDLFRRRPAAGSPGGQE